MSEFQGIGFGIHGPEESYIVFVDDEGEERTVSAHHMVPPDGRAPWSFYEALTGGFGDRSAEVMTRDRAIHDVPRAYRLRITVEAEPLTHAETEELLARCERETRRTDVYECPLS
jgi:hypothetical protein